MRRTIRPILALMLLSTVFHSGTAAANSATSAAGNAQAASDGNRAADLSAMENFQLSDDFIKKYQGYEDEAAKNPCELSPMLAMRGAGAENRSLTETIRVFDARPGVHAALERNGLTARDLLLGMGVLVGAAAQEMVQQHPELAKNGTISINGKISPANMAVYQRNKDALLRHQRELGRAQLQANGGKLPACMSGQ